jgi:hypothetical protein
MCLAKKKSQSKKLNFNKLMKNYKFNNHKIIQKIALKNKTQQQTIKNSKYHHHNKKI